MDYQAYLKSPHWKAVRAWAIERAGGVCQICRSGGLLEAHHNNYKNLGAELPGDLIVLCRGCHGLYSTRLPPPPLNDDEPSAANSGDFPSERTLRMLQAVVQRKRRIEEARKGGAK